MWIIFNWKKIAALKNFESPINNSDLTFFLYTFSEQYLRNFLQLNRVYYFSKHQFFGKNNLSPLIK